MRIEDRPRLLGLALVVAACGDDTTYPPISATQLQILSGQAQVDTVNRQLAEPVIVETLDADGHPVAGVSIHYEVLDGDGSVHMATVRSDEMGTAANRWTLGPRAGIQRLRVFTPAPRGPPLDRTFTATAVADSVKEVQLIVSRFVVLRGGTILTTDTVSFIAYAFDRFSNLHSDTGFVWSLSDSLVASIESVDRGIVLFPVDTGPLTVRAYKEGYSASYAARIRPPPVPPTVTITEPADSSKHLEGEVITFVAEASDPNGRIRYVRWSSGRDGDLGAGDTLTRGNLSPGWHEIRAIAVDEEDARDTAVVRVRIETLPDVAIGSPRHAALFDIGEAVQMSGTVVDRDGGSATLTWRSSLDGVLGSGQELVRADLTAGVHEIILTARDDEAQTDSASVGISVARIGTGSPSALAFAQDRVEVPDDPSLDLILTWTLEAWVNPQAGNGPLISKWGAEGEESFRFYLVGSRPYLLWAEGDITHGFRSNQSVVLGEWQHVAAVFSTDTAKLYLNGVLVGVAPRPIPPETADSPLTLGSDESGYYEGSIDEVRVWNVARSQSEIFASMLVEIAPDVPGLVGYWRLDEGSGDVAFDLTPNANHGRLGDSVGVDGRDPLWTTAGAPLTVGGAGSSVGRRR